MRTIKYLLVFFLVGVSLVALFCSGCAKQVGDDNVPVVAEGIRDAGTTVTGYGLKYLYKNYPQEVPVTIDHFNSIVEIANLYTDGLLTGLDVAKSITDIVDQVNARFHLLNTVYVDLLATGLDFLSRQFDRFTDAKELPVEFGIYLSAFSAGIEDGLVWFYENTDYGEVIPEVPAPVEPMPVEPMEAE